MFPFPFNVDRGTLESNKYLTIKHSRCSKLLSILQIFAFFLLCMFN